MTVPPMKSPYSAPQARVTDLDLERSFCQSGSLKDTYDDPFDFEP